MQLHNLTVHNLGVFDARHDFDLTPIKNPDGTFRHVTVVSGHNGAGKSTLFQALDLALHGSFSLGDRIPRQTYTTYLLGRLHRRKGPGSPIIRPKGGASVSFGYVESGVPLRIQADRRWQRRSTAVTESLSILRNGDPPDVAPSDYQNWLNDLFPPALAPLCFFDAERLEHLVDTEQPQGLLQDTLQRLLGLDLIAKLGTDLNRYVTNQGKGQQALARLRLDVLQHQSEVDGWKEQVEQCVLRAAALMEAMGALEDELAAREEQFAAEGGTYATRRPALQSRLQAIQQRTNTLAEQLRELCGELLPFTFVPDLSLRLRGRLRQETETRHRTANTAAWQRRIDALPHLLTDERLWEGLDVLPEQRGALTQRLIEALSVDDRVSLASDPPLLHDLAQADQDRLYEWITTALHAIPQQIVALGTELRSLQAEAREVEEALRRAPDDQAIAPLFAEITRLQQELSNIRGQQAELSEQRGVLQFQHDEAQRKLQRAVDELTRAQMADTQTSLAERSRVALRAFADVLTRQRLSELEANLLTSFNTICQKERLLREVRVRPEDFTVQLEGANGHPLHLADFSAGERQLYGLALLWALRQVSGRQLPLAIDTPLARLDEAHRTLLLREYVPAVSNQVILFATDAELDAGLLTEIEPYIARIYRLRFDPELEETVIKWEGRPLAPLPPILSLTPRPRELVHDA